MYYFIEFLSRANLQIFLFLIYFFSYASSPPMEQIERSNVFHISLRKEAILLVC